MSNPKQELADFIAAVHALLTDIESMRLDNSGQFPEWFGPFSEFNATENFGEPRASIEWSNLSISADNVKRALSALDS